MTLSPSTPAMPPRVDLDRSLPGELSRVVNRELEPGEEVVYFGQPVARRMALGTSTQVLFAVPWTAFAVFWMWGASQGSVVFSLWGVPFVVIGLRMLTSPLWAVRDARRTVYVITNRRALIVRTTGILRSELVVRSFAPEVLRSVERREALDGSGDLVFEKRQERGSKGRTHTVETGFLAVPAVAEVAARIRDLAWPAADVDGPRTS